MQDWKQQLDEHEPPTMGPPPPDDTSPMLATLTETPFDDPDWIFERKLDGERALVFRVGGKVDLRSRNHNPLGDHYPELIEAFQKLDAPDFVADGEIVAFEDDVSSFQRLQQRMGIADPEEALATGISVWMYLFDLLWIDGHDVTGLPLRVRKELLRTAIAYHGSLRFMPHRNESGVTYFEEACKKGWEGLIAKDAATSYEHRRSHAWLKFKCVNRQELVIGGFTDPKGERVGFGALLVGYYQDGKLHYAGRVGTGYSDSFLDEFRHWLHELEVTESPFDVGDPGDAHFVKPTAVGEFEFTEWTNDGKLRHPRFLGLRYDKDPEDVVREAT